MIPKKIQPYFEITQQTGDRDNSIIEGVLTCCNEQDFEVFVVGEIKRRPFSRMHLFSENDRIVIEARCRKCGRVIPLFDSGSDGYEKCGNKQYTPMPMKPVDCKKCQNGGFSVRIRYEYPDIQELKELEVPEIDTAFTWIWITLVCNKCGARYEKFVDYETA